VATVSVEVFDLTRKY